MDISPLRPVNLELSGDRIHATYRVSGDAARADAVLAQLVVEQTIEFPPELVPDDDIREHIVGRVESIQRLGDHLTESSVSYAAEVAGGQLPQLLNVLFGNISMVPGVRLTDVELPSSFIEGLRGPRIGLAGLRARFSPQGGPLLATALKPMGTPVDALARMAYDLARNGLHLVKDDHSFADQPFAAFRERVPALARAIELANVDRGEEASVYLPALNLPSDRLQDGMEVALEAGAGGVLLLPGLVGWDTMRALAESVPDGVIIMAHPSFLGSHVTDPTSGLSHGLLFGTLPRLTGADVSIFPNHGGRFSFSPEACTEIADACRAELPGVAPAFPAPGGGMSLERVPEMLRFYGDDVCLLIGGSLYRGEISTQVQGLRTVIEESS